MPVDRLLHAPFTLTLQAALWLTLLVVLGRSVLNALEVLAHPGDYRTEGTYSWGSRRPQRKWTREGSVASLTDVIFSGRAFLLITVLQLLLCAWLAATVLREHRDPNRAVLWLLFGVEALGDFRNSSFGHDGSDRMHLLVLLAVAIAFSFTDPAARAIAVAFIALQVMLAYFTAGAIKALAPRWRDGRAMAVVLCSENFGTPRAGAWLLQHPFVSRAMGWSVIAFELAFPFLLWWGPRVTVAALAIAFFFHLGVAVLMGLNSFVWSFAAAYPAVYWLSAHRAVQIS